MREACEHPRDQKRTTHETHWLTDTMAISSESELVVKPGLHIGCPSVYIYQLTISPISQLGIDGYFHMIAEPGVEKFFYRTRDQHRIKIYRPKTWQQRQA